MMITDQEATELKTWVVKKLEDMYQFPPCADPMQENMENRLLFFRMRLMIII